MQQQKSLEHKNAFRAFSSKLTVPANNIILESDNCSSKCRNGGKYFLSRFDCGFFRNVVKYSLVKYKEEFIFHENLFPYIAYLELFIKAFNIAHCNKNLPCHAITSSRHISFM